MVRILTPVGTVEKFNVVRPVVEAKMKFNGSNRIVMEKAMNLSTEPTGIYLSCKGQPSMGFCLESTREFYVGNLPAEKVKEILKTLLTEGYYDFSQFDYQDTKSFAKVVFDKGASKPYCSDPESSDRIPFIE